MLLLGLWVGVVNTKRSGHRAPPFHHGFAEVMAGANIGWMDDTSLLALTCRKQRVVGPRVIRGKVCNRRWTDCCRYVNRTTYFLNSYSSKVLCSKFPPYTPAKTRRNNSESQRFPFCPIVDDGDTNNRISKSDPNQQENNSTRLRAPRKLLGGGRYTRGTKNLEHLGFCVGV